MIEVLSQPSCQPCRATVRALDRGGVAYVDVPLATERGQALLQEAYDRGHRESPVVFIRAADGSVEDCWSGFRPDRLKELA